MPPVAAPADKRFRRSHVKPSGKRSSSRLRHAWLVARAVALVAVVVYAGWRGAALVASATALQVGHIIVTRQRAAVHRRRARAARRAARPQHPRRRPGRVAGSPAVVAVGGGGDAASRLARRRWKCGCASARRWRSAASAARSISSIPTAPSSTSTVRPTPTSTCRSSTAWRPGATRRPLDETPRRAGGARDRRAERAPGSRGQGVADRRHRRARRGGDARRRHDAAAPRRERLRRAPAAVPRPRRRRSASACPRSITWICVSTNVCTCGRPRGRRRRRLRRRHGGRVERRQRGTA